MPPVISCVASARYGPVTLDTAIWDFYPWLFTIAAVSKVTGSFLADATQDITGGIPADFYRLLWARLNRTDLTDGSHYAELTPVQRLDPQSPSLKRDMTWHEFLTYVPEKQAFRLEYPLYIYTGTEL